MRSPIIQVCKASEPSRTRLRAGPGHLFPLSSRLNAHSSDAKPREYQESRLFSLLMADSDWEPALVC